MISKQYQDLIQKDIDGVNTLEERSELEVYLARNPEARRLHSELSALSDMLVKVPTKEPPPNLKKNILNSLKPLRAGRTRPHERSQSGLGLLKSLVSLKIGLAFAAGLVIGLGLYAITGQSGSTDPSGVYGAMIQKDAPSGFTTVESHSINLPQVQGKLELRRSRNHLRLEVAIASPLNLNGLIQFRGNEVGFRGIASLNGEVFGTVGVDSNRVLLSDISQKAYVVVFDRRAQPIESANEQLTVDVRLAETGKVLFSKTMAVFPPEE